MLNKWVTILLCVSLRLRIWHHSSVISGNIRRDWQSFGNIPVPPLLLNRCGNLVALWLSLGSQASIPQIFRWTWHDFHSNWSHTDYGQTLDADACQKIEKYAGDYSCFAFYSYLIEYRQSLSYLESSVVWCVCVAWSVWSHKRSTRNTNPVGTDLCVHGHVLYRHTLC